jgi:hypothetical protein
MLNDIIATLFQDMIKGTLRRRVVTTSLLILLIAFCAAVGFGLAGTHTSGWSVAIFSIAAVAALQIAYIVTLIIEAVHH